MNITKRDLERIKWYAGQQAKKWGGADTIHIEVGERFSLDKQTPEGRTVQSINIAAVSDDPHWNDTDLYTTHPFLDIVKKDVQHHNGKAIFDFYIYHGCEDGEDYHGDLICNIQAYFTASDKASNLYQIDADIETLWKKETKAA